MQADESAVFGAANVELESDAKGQAGAEGGERAFRRGVHQAAMADNEWATGLCSCGLGDKQYY
jgi:hypothetical protein